MTEPVSVSRRIDAPATAVFTILANPAMHQRIDGSGMVRATITHSRVTRAGAVFGMRMYSDEMGDYVMMNHVVEYERDRRIGWEPVLSEASRPEDKPEVGNCARHRWSYRLAPDDRGTVVTETFDCSQSPYWLRRAVRNGENWLPSMIRTLERLDQLITTGAAIRTARLTAVRVGC